MHTHMLSWGGAITPAALLPQCHEALDPACSALARRGKIGHYLTLDPMRIVHLDDGTVKADEMIQWEVKLVSTEAIIGGIAGCSFSMTSIFCGKPVKMSFLVPYPHLRRHVAEEEAET